MKVIISLLSIFTMALASCQTKNTIMPVDKTESEKAVTRVLDEHWSAVKAKDADAVLALLSDDILACGSDSKEFWTKTDISNNIEQAFADTSSKIEIKIDKRVIRIAKDGNSAIALEQMFLTAYSSKIPVRNIYHLIKVNDDWLFDFTSVSFIPDNEDIGKLNKALEQ